MKPFDKLQKSNKANHISVCICTFKRPQLLKRLLNKLQEQKRDGRFTYSIVVVDNDYCQSGKDAVINFKKTSTVDINYYHEPVQNISLARNKAVQNAIGDLIAFIDDDEFPEVEWLLNLYNAIIKFKADGILGPVKPHFENDPPSWIIKSKILERQSFKTGTVIPHSRYTRTGNVLLYRSLYKNDDDYFDTIYGRIGGGDAVFFKRMMEKGKVYVWCNEAIVFETVLPERQKFNYHVKRAIARGVSETRDVPFISFNTLKSIIAFMLYSMALPFLLITNYALFFKFLIKNCDHIGKLLAYCGINVIKERPY